MILNTEQERYLTKLYGMVKREIKRRSKLKLPHPDDLVIFGGAHSDTTYSLSILYDTLSTILLKGEYDTPHKDYLNKSSEVYNHLKKYKE